MSGEQKQPAPSDRPAFGLVDERTWINLRMERIVEVINEMRDEGYCDTHMRPLEDEFTFLRGRLSMLDAPAPQNHVGASIVPPHCSGTALAFDPGVLHVNKDGGGYIAINEEDFVLEDDRCEGPDGPEGSIHWIVRMDASEMAALRDFLNGAKSPASDVTGWQDISTAPVNTDVIVYWPIVKLDDDGDPTAEIVGGNVLISENQGGYWIEPDVINAIGDHMGDEETYADHPSHWMPKPEAPAAMATEGSSHD